MSLALLVRWSYEKISRQFPETVRLHDPFRSPLRGCRFQPGNRRSCSSVSAVSRANKSLRSLSAIAGGTPLAFPSSWSCLSPLWRKRTSCTLSLHYSSMYGYAVHVKRFIVEGKTPTEPPQLTTGSGPASTRGITARTRRNAGCPTLRFLKGGIPRSSPAWDFLLTPP